MKRTDAAALLLMVGASACGERSSPNETAVAGEHETTVKGNTMSEWVTSARGSDPDAAVGAFAALSDDAVRKGGDAALAVDTLAAALADEKWSGKPAESRVRSAAAESLAKFGEQARSAEPAMVRLASRKDLDTAIRFSLWKLAEAIHPIKQDDKTTALNQMGALAAAVNFYISENKNWPKSLEELTVPVGQSEPFMKKIPRDPWGEEYEYKIVNIKTREFTITSAGPDREYGTADDIVFPEKGKPK